MVFAVVEQLVLLHTLDLYPLQTEVARTHLVLLVIERVKNHPINKTLRLVHFLFTTEKLESYFGLTFINLFSYRIDGLLQNFENVDSAVKVSYFASHSYQHRSYKYPHLLFHFLRLDQRCVKVYFLKLK